MERNRKGNRPAEAEPVPERQPRIETRLRLNDIVANGVADQFADGMAIETAHDVGAMGLSGLDAEVEGDGDFLAALAFGEELNDLALAGSETLTRRLRVDLGGFLIEIAVQNHLGDAGSKKGLVATDGVDRADQVAAGIALEEVSAGTGAEDFANEGI